MEYEHAIGGRSSFLPDKQMYRMIRGETLSSTTAAGLQGLSQKCPQDDEHEDEHVLEQKESDGYSKPQSNSCQSPEVRTYHMEMREKMVEAPVAKA